MQLSNLLNSQNNVNTAFVHEVSRLIYYLAWGKCWEITEKSIIKVFYIQSHGTLCTEIVYHGDRLRTYHKDERNCVFKRVHSCNSKRRIMYQLATQEIFQAWGMQTETIPVEYIADLSQQDLFKMEARVRQQNGVRAVRSNLATADLMCVLIASEDVC
jgi:hypothetical protein